MAFISGLGFLLDVGETLFNFNIHPILSVSYAVLYLPIII